MLERKSEIYLLYLILNIITLTILLLQACISARSNEVFRAKIDMVKALGITDICLFTDAQYTRNPSTAIPGASFQDSPMTLDIFPSGTFLTPPPHLNHHEMD